MSAYPDVNTAYPVVTTAPAPQGMTISGRAGKKDEWSNDMFDCCKSPNCCMAFCCTLCFACTVASKIEGTCWAACCGGLMPIRSFFRGKHGIKGSVVEDFCWHVWCGPCAAIQLYEEALIRED